MLLVTMLVLTTAVLAFYVTGGKVMKNSASAAFQQTSVAAQANNIARGGLTDAINWFRAQAVQPVRQNGLPCPDAAFGPAGADDTIDSSIGLVKEFPIGGAGSSLYGRYEVRKQSCDSAVDPHAVHDVTPNRTLGGLDGDGLAWSIESLGIVYQKPNRILARSRVSTEIYRISVELPANSAVIVNDRSGAACQNNGRIIGGAGNIGLAYYGGVGAGTCVPPLASGGYASTFDISSATSTAISFQDIFGLTLDDLRLMADITVGGGESLPAAYPAMGVVFVKGDATFNSGGPLTGGGILVVDGDLTIESSANALFSGVIFVTGDAEVQGPATVSGSLIVQGGLTMDGMGNVAEVLYSGNIINSVSQQAGQYREKKSAFYGFSALR